MDRLMWNPALEFDESCTGTLVGWHRAFCLRLTAGRGTVCQPGRMLALKEGGRTTGVAYKLPENALEQELTLLVEAGNDYRLLSSHLVPAGAG
ncbi:cation transport protein [Citrobacter koseri]|nr:cation transport protein [Citrobacter koseri]